MTEQQTKIFEPLATLGNRPIDAGALAATLEIVYMQETLIALSATHRCAIDVGAHRGDVTEALTSLGFRVLSVEPQPMMAERLGKRFEALIKVGMVHVERSAASDRDDKGSLIIGKASTVTTLETSWTRIAFPEEFQNSNSVDVSLRPLADMMRASGLVRPAFVKIDVEGHELPALQGLFAADTEGDRLPPPPVVMFEANQRFADAARDCISLLARQGYTRFDIFIRDGVTPIASARFGAPAEGAEPLPRAWFACGDKYFYANVIAYHASVDEALLPESPQSFVQCYQLQAARDVLRRGMKLETHAPPSVHPIWIEARGALRDYVLRDDWREFLNHPICRNMFYRGRWGPAQDRELAALQASPVGRALLQRVIEPELGGARFSTQLPTLSSNMLGMLYYLMRVASTQQQGAQSIELPQSLIEIGGGYGAFAWLYATQAPGGAYTIVDLPEMLAIQHYYLSLALPGHRVRLAEAAQDAIARAGEIVLVPVALLDQAVDAQATPLGQRLRCEQLFSTFGFSEFPRDLQRRIEGADYFRAQRILLAGQLASELPDLHLVGHSDVVGAAMQRFERLTVERFHIGDNYLLLGSRGVNSAAA